MRTLLAVALTLFSVPVLAQDIRSTVSPQVKLTQPTEVTTAQLQDALKKAMEALKPGVVLTDRNINVTDVGPYNVAVAFVARPGNKSLTGGALSHDKITEIYYILRGSGTQVTGTTLVNAQHRDLGGAVGPSWSSNELIPNGRKVKLSAGEIQIIPPGVGHQWIEIAEGGIDYLTIRVDPEHVTTLSK